MRESGKWQGWKTGDKANRRALRLPCHRRSLRTNEGKRTRKKTALRRSCVFVDSGFQTRLPLFRQQLKYLA
jgi:hypothetical protein